MRSWAPAVSNHLSSSAQPERGCANLHAPARLAPVEYWRPSYATVAVEMTTTRKRRIIRIPVPVTDSGSHLSKASKPSPQPGKCAKNHTLRRASAEEGLSCDACNRALHCGDTIWCCEPCDYALCGGCYVKLATGASILAIIVTPH